jgi:tripartite ATP-independent transporter DctP family solute receptor
LSFTVHFSAARASIKAVLVVMASSSLFGLCTSDATAAKALKLGYILSQDSQLGGGAKVFAAEVARRTAGRYIIEDYPNAMLGDEVAMMKDVQLGATDLAFITGAPLAAIVPEAGVFNIPFLFHNIIDARAFFDSPIGETYLRKFDKSGMVALAWGENGMRHLTNSKRPIKTPDDLRGLKLRLPQSEVMAAGFKALGADVQLLPFKQVYSALKSERVDGEENPIATIAASRFGEVQNNLTLSAHVYDPAIILMSTDAFDAMSEEDKASFKEAAVLAGRASRAFASRAEETGVAVLKAQGMAVTELTDRAAFSAKLSAVAPFFEERFGRDVIAMIRDYRASNSARVAPGVRP